MNEKNYGKIFSKAFDIKILRKQLKIDLSRSEESHC